MKAARVHDRIVLLFAPAEAKLLGRILQSIIRCYQIKPEDIHPAVAEVWYSRRGCASAGMNEEQSREWVQHLHEFKSANIAALRRWKTQLTPEAGGVPRLELADEDSHVLLTVLNDHRLMSAARHNIADEEMSIRDWKGLQQLRPRRQAAVIDIVFLGGIIETILALLPGNYGDWPAYAG